MSININDIVKGQITGITKYGVFVSLEDDYVGMIHISEVSDKFVSDLTKVFTIGQIIGVKVISIEEDKRQVKLSIKSIKPRIRKTKKRIEEQGSGFDLLKENLDGWVTEKISELSLDE